jgi:hypothetical protein
MMVSAQRSGALHGVDNEKTPKYFEMNYRLCGQNAAKCETKTESIHIRQILVK